MGQRVPQVMESWREFGRRTTSTELSVFLHFPSQLEEPLPKSLLERVCIPGLSVRIWYCGMCIVHCLFKTASKLQWP